ncbi:MAG: chemotaxis protein CheX [Leptospirales bacterium]|jgi:chemotaxis protein CheX
MAENAELTVDSFIQSTVAFYEKATGESPKIEKIDSVDNEPQLQQYTGITGIGGAYRGAIYVSCEREMLVDLFAAMYPGVPIEEALILDQVGELANNLAGMAQESFTDAFEISCPIVVQNGQGADLFILRKPVHTFRLAWRAHTAFLGLGIGQA